MRSNGTTDLLTPLDRMYRRARRLDNGCLVVDSPLTAGGYILLWDGTIPGKRYGHRWAYEDQVGPIPDGLTIDHLCRTTNCIEISHLEPVTLIENQRRASRPDPDKCGSGRHDWVEENIYTWVNKDGRTFRSCRPCQRERDRRRYKKETADA